MQLYSARCMLELFDSCSLTRTYAVLFILLSDCAALISSQVNTLLPTQNYKTEIATLFP